MKDHNLKEHTTRFWEEFYARHNLRNDPSPFSLWCLENNLLSNSRILELGCGNGRDSFTFLHHGLPVLAVDGCEVAIADNLAHYTERGPRASGTFRALDFTRLDTLLKQTPELFNGELRINTVYSRFVLHAIPEAVEDAVLDFCLRILPPGGRMLHEFRTLRDPLMQQGEILSANERLTDHYRRFLDPDAFRAKLAAQGWKELFFIESQGLAVFGNDNPVVARVVVEKPILDN